MNRFRMHKCKICENETILGVCCGENTSFLDLSYRNIDLQAIWNEAKKNAGIFNNLFLLSLLNMLIFHIVVKVILRFHGQ